MAKIYIVAGKAGVYRICRLDPNHRTIVVLEIDAVPIRYPVRKTVLSDPFPWRIEILLLFSDDRLKRASHRPRSSRPSRSVTPSLLTRLS
jgi:hypothetical protein